jgi:cytochrome c peroxidase
MKSRWWMLLLVSGCGDPPWQWQLPLGFVEPRVPEDNPMTEAKVALGHRLFFDPRLSVNEEQSCASCHFPERAFSDDKATPTGTTGDAVPRNAMTLANAAYWSTYTWANPVLTTLEEQAAVPLFATHPDPIEIGAAEDFPAVVDRLQADADYPRLFEDAFGGFGNEVPTATNIAQAIASYERTLISGNSRYDRYSYGGDVQLTDDERAGFSLFFSERAECYHCHGGSLFSTAFVSASSTTTERAFENNGYGDGDDRGLAAITGRIEDEKKFRVPTLRNIEKTAPYMHNGGLRTLEDVIAHYVRGGAGLEGQSTLVKPLDLSDVEQRQLIAFLRTLTDDTFGATDEQQDPFAQR